MKKRNFHHWWLSLEWFQMLNRKKKQIHLACKRNFKCIQHKIQFDFTLCTCRDIKLVLPEIRKSPTSSIRTDCPSSHSHTPRILSPLPCQSKISQQYQWFIYMQYQVGIKCTCKYITMYLVFFINTASWVKIHRLGLNRGSS